MTDSPGRHERRGRHEVDLWWTQHRWPDGHGVGHRTALPCMRSCLPEEGRETTLHDEVPKLSWEREPADDDRHGWIEGLRG